MSAVRISETDPVTVADAIRGLAPVADEVRAEVAAIIEAVRAGGHEAVVEYATRLDGLPAGTPLRVSAEELSAALAALEPDLRAALELARDNIGAVAAATTAAERSVQLGPGHVVHVREVPVHRAAIYAPGGRNPYPSTVLMGVCSARAAGVSEIAVCVPGGHPVMLAACALCGVDEVWRIGGAHAVAALGLGTDQISPVDVLAGPGNHYVQEAKRQLAGTHFGIDGFAGPSDLLLLADGDVRSETVVADLRAQAEHGSGSIVGLVCTPGPLAEVVLSALSGGVAGNIAVAVLETPEAALAVCERFAPEHLQLVGPGMEALADRVTRAGCTFIGAATGVAFGDYVAGSNHTLPTGGAARFASVMSARTFRRLTSNVELSAEAAAHLAVPGAAIAQAEGFAQHADSMILRKNQDR